MERKREPRAIGEKLLLGETEYRIEEVEGYGGSAVVYRASYQDRLNPESIHRVLIKELFPYHSKGFIYRDAKGNICCVYGAVWAQFLFGQSGKSEFACPYARADFGKYKFLCSVWNVLFRAASAWGRQSEESFRKKKVFSNVKRDGAVHKKDIERSRIFPQKRPASS